MCKSDQKSESKRISFPQEQGGRNMLLRCAFSIFLKPFNPQRCLVGEEHERSCELYIMGKTGRLEWEEKSFSSLQCWERWMSATDMSFLPKLIFIFLSTGKETICCHGGDRQGLGVCCVTTFFATVRFPCFINPLCSYYRMPFCCPGVGISSFQWLKKSVCLCFLLDVNLMLYRSR